MELESRFGIESKPARRQAAAVKQTAGRLGASAIAAAALALCAASAHAYDVTTSPYLLATGAACAPAWPTRA